MALAGGVKGPQPARAPGHHLAATPNRSQPGRCCGARIRGGQELAPAGKTASCLGRAKPAKILLGIVTESPQPSKKTVREFSAGGVVVRRMRGQWHMAAIEPNVVNADSITRNALRQRRRPAILALPKGAIDRGESPKQGAIREVLEETGVLVQPITKLGDIKYFYVRSWGGRERVFKVVTFFLFRYMSGRLGDIQPAMRKEVRRAVWLPLEEAHEKLTYPGERQVVQLARKYIRAHPELEPTP